MTSERISRLRDSATTFLVLAGAAVIPLVIIRDASDPFRVVKDATLHAEAIALAAVTAACVILGSPLPRPKWRDRAVLIPLLVLSVFIVLTHSSTKPALSANGLVTACATVIIFFATTWAATVRRRWTLVAIPMAAAVVNALLVMVEESGIWMPFGERTDLLHHLQCSALIGNPNEVGGYLGAAALGGLALAIVLRKPLPFAVAATCVAGLVASRTLTAMIAFSVAAFSLALLTSWPHKRALVVICMIAALSLIVIIAPLRTRVVNMAHWLRSGDYNALLTDRLTPFAAAATMFADRPVTGVGPGAFSWHYFDYKLRVERRYPLLRKAYSRGLNYGEVHNDHLQALAEGGIIGYGTLLFVFGAVASMSWAIPVDASDPWQRFARLTALPVAVYFVILSLAQFPLQTTVVRTLLVHFVALAAAWRNG